VQGRVAYLLSAATVLCAEGMPADALALFQEARTPENKLAARHVFSKRALVEAVDAALDAGDLGAADELLAEWERMRPVDRTASLIGHRERLTARLAAQRGESEAVEPAFRRAASIFVELNTPYYLAVTLLERGEWLTGQGHRDEADPLLAEAHEIFDRLGAKPWLIRLEAARSTTPAEIPA
jgi:tetratricopeptide (TPR) repeat protein